MPITERILHDQLCYAALGPAMLQRSIDCIAVEAIVLTEQRGRDLITQAHVYRLNMRPPGVGYQH